MLLFTDWCAFFSAGLAIAVHTEDMLRDLAIAEVVNVVRDYEEEIETGEKGVWKGDVTMWVFVGVILAVYRIGGRYNTAAGVEGGVDAGFGNGDCLLFHDFVNRHSVNVAHFVKLVYTNHAPVSENHGASFETSFSCLFVRCHCRCETNARGPSTSRCDCQRCCIQHKPEQLRLRSRRVSDHQDVDISS